MTMTETPIPDEALLVGVVAWPRSTFIYLRDHGGQSWLLPLTQVAAGGSARPGHDLRLHPAPGHRRNILTKFIHDISFIVGGGRVWYGSCSD